MGKQILGRIKKAVSTSLVVLLLLALTVSVGAACETTTTTTDSNSLDDINVGDLTVSQLLNLLNGNSNSLSNNWSNLASSNTNWPNINWSGNTNSGFGI